MGQSIVLGGGPRLVTAICAADTRVFMLSDGALRATAEGNPNLWPKLLSLAYAQQRALVEMVSMLTALRPRQRLIVRLLSLAKYDECIPISQAQIGEIVGASRKAVNGWLREWEKANLIVCGYRQITVLNRGGLASALDK